MISELRFAKSYSSVWRGLAPTMELFVRKANLRLYSRDSSEMTATSLPSARSMINQVAFQTVVNVRKLLPASEVLSAVQDPEHLRAAELGLSGVELLDEAGVAEAGELAVRMVQRLFGSGLGSVVLSPRFEGCGILNACFGDAQASSGEILELKDGDRPFRSYDFRQVSIYAALHFNSTSQPPPFLTIVNSRRGISMRTSLDDLANEVAGQSGIDYLREIVRVVTDASIS